MINKKQINDGTFNSKKNLNKFSSPRSIFASKNRRLPISLQITPNNRNKSSIRYPRNSK